MKTKISLLCLFAALTAWAKPIVIKGKINGKLPDNLYYTAPVNGVLGFDFYYTASIDKTGNFEINTDIIDPTFIDLYYNYQPAGYIIVKPGGTYAVTITEANGNVAHTIDGDDAALQKLYNSIVPTHRFSLASNLAREAAAITSPQDFESFFETRLNADLKTLNITTQSANGVTKMLLLERRFFYAMSLNFAVYKKHSISEFDTGIAVPAAFNTIWQNIYTKINPNDTALQTTPLGYWYINSYKFYKMYEAVGFDGKKIANTTSMPPMERMVQYIPEKNLDYYLAADLYSRVSEGQMEKSTYLDYLDYQKQYPNSPYSKYLEPKMVPLVSFYAQSGELPQGAAYVEGYNEVNSLEELIKKCPGKKLYIDVWATWCGWCREEFKYKNELYKLLKANDITVVYLSVDEESRDEGWKKMIGYYGLLGHHIRTNKAFSKQLYQLYNGTGGLAIPWHILVNNKGVVSALHAPAPSELDKLETEIKKLQ